MLRCYEDESESPREGCGCRSCYRAREHRLPEALLKFISEQMNCTISPYKMPGPAISGVRQIMMVYCMGRVSLEEAWVEIIKQLVTQNNYLFDQIATLEMLKPITMVVPKHTVCKSN
jgi:hypothetical protein